MRRIGYLILCILVCVSSSAWCMSTLYLVQQTSGAAGSSDVLLKYENGIASTVGSIGFTDVRGLAYDASSDILYGVSRSNDTRLITINSATGVGTAVSTNPYLAVNANTAEISFRADGTLFGAGNRYNTSATDTLFSVNTTTGIAANAGSFGTDLLGLAFDHHTGILYGSDYNGKLYVINQTTGAAIFLGDVWGSYGKVTRIAFDQADGQLYGITNYSQLVSIDLLTYQATKVYNFKNIDTQIYSLDFQSQTPEPATMSMLALGALALIRRRK